MKFPLQRAPFAPLQLSAADHEAMADLADVFVNETLADYESHLEDDHGVVNEARWKLFKKFDNVTVFQDREGLQSRRMSRDDMGESETPKDLQRLLWFGTVAGDLDDLMFGVINPTAAEARIKSAYVGNNVLDFAVLDTIVEATPDDPFRGLQVKWAVNGGPTMMRAMVRPRDFVYLESTGMTRTTKGERIGYHILHSIEIPGVPELHEHKIVRGSMTLYHLYRQKSDGVVETYVKAFIDLLGDMPAAVGAMVSAKGVVSVWKLAECSQLKKLSWMLSKRQPVQPSPNSDICNVCTRSMSAIVGRTKTCKACKARVCSKCCVGKKMCYFSQLTREVLQQNVTFCIQCVRTATRTNGLEVALDEMHARRKRKQSTLQWYTTGMVSPTSSSASMSW